MLRRLLLLTVLAVGAVALILGLRVWFPDRFSTELQAMVILEDSTSSNSITVNGYASKWYAFDNAPNFELEPSRLEFIATGGSAELRREGEGWTFVSDGRQADAAAVAQRLGAVPASGLIESVLARAWHGVELVQSAFESERDSEPGKLIYPMSRASRYGTVQDILAAACALCVIFIWAMLCGLVVRRRSKFGQAKAFDA